VNRIVVEADRRGPRISRHIYGHFAEHLGRCIYEGLWVGEGSAVPNTRGIRDDVVGALRALKMPNLRWPGGCFADTYHWMDGVGPREKRPEIVNIHWGGTTESNHFGTHEFFDLCERLGTEPYICGNVGSGTVREMAEWLEYITMPGSSPMRRLRAANGREEPWDIEYWAVGNENWGCGGNMTAQQYAWEYRRFQTYCRHFGGKKLYKIACGQQDDWNEVLMREAARFMDGLSVHYYTFAEKWERKGAAAGFPLSDWYGALKNCLGIEDFLRRTEAIMDRYDPEKRVGMIVDEWGGWWDCEPGTNPGFLYQQNTIRDALIAGVSLNVFNRHADRVRMANIAQTVNVLQAMILTEGSRMVLTPTYHVFDMYKVHQDATLLGAYVDAERLEAGAASLPAVEASASRDAEGRTHLSLCNLSADKEAAIEIEVRGAPAAPKLARGRILAARATDAHNDFDHPDAVVPAEWEIGAVGGKLSAKLPPMSVAVVEIS
jgi:alpha-L-arabinofuranosidase